MTKTQREIRADNTLSAHNILLRLDGRDFQGNVTFNFKKGEGIKSYKIEEFGNFKSIFSHESGEDYKSVDKT